jgi:CofD-related protein of GAK system
VATIPPDRGPRLLFFSGGSALNPLSETLTRYTHNSIHLITPFDSGGSSATLRRAFSMLAVGDLRSRITALLDRGAQHAPAVARLLDERFANLAVPAALVDRLDKMAAGSSPLTRDLPRALRDLLRADLSTLARMLPRGFDLRGASVGNLVLAGGYLRNDRDINRTLGNISSAAQVRGIVRPSADCDAHLAARLAGGDVIVGQHEITREAATATAPIVELLAVESLDLAAEIEVPAYPLALKLIGQAELLCYPMGSFWTSVIANLLPAGIGSAIAASDRIKVYVPSTGRDPEMAGRTLSGAVEVIVETCRRDAGADTPIDQLIDAVIIDRDHRRYAMAIDIDGLRVRGIGVIERDLASDADRSKLSPVKLAQTLCELAGKRR